MPNVPPSSSNTSQDDLARPLVEEFPELISNLHVAMLRVTIWVVLLGTLMIAGAMGMLLEARYAWRMTFPLLLAANAAAGLWMLRQSGVVASVRTLIVGGWLVATIGSFFTEGVRAPILFAYPVLVIFSGWVLGARFGAGLFIASCIAIVAMSVAQTLGVVGGAPPFPPIVTALAHLIVLSISVAMTMYLIRSFRQSYARYRLIAERIQDVVWVLDVESMRFRFMSPSVQKLRGYTPEEVLAMPVTAVLTPDAAQGIVERIRQRARDFVSGKEPPDRFYVSEIEQPCKDGSTVWTEVISSYCRNPTDGSVEVRGVTRDITARRKAEEALRSDAGKLRAIFSTMSEGVSLNEIVYDDKGDMIDYRIIEVNEAFYATADYRGRPVIGRLATDLYGMSPETIREFWKARRRRTDVQHIEMLSPISQHWFHISTSPFVNDRFVTTFMDITERKRSEAEQVRLEAQLRESQKMEALGTLAGGVAHDFNNALAMIVGNTELARQDVGPGHAALESLEEIDQASRRAKDLVGQILAFSRRQNIDRKPSSLTLVVVETARLLRASLPAKVTLSVECKVDTPAVLADATQVSQILLNLCNNALQALQDEERPGHIEISLGAHAQDEQRGELRPGRYACLMVRDNGPGMDEETRARIFEPFFTTKPRGKGTGLGLAVVHGIVKAHEASIEVESAPGAGCTFRIFFPATDAPVTGAKAPASQTSPVRGDGKHVLYVDDEEAIVSLMKRLLERRGYRVSGYTDPKEAVAAVGADPGRYDLVVTDYNMPGMTGVEVAKALKTVRADLPVLLASGYITEELRRTAPGAGVSALIYKPNTVEDLCAAVERYANGQQEDMDNS